MVEIPPLRHLRQKATGGIEALCGFEDFSYFHGEGRGGPSAHI